MIEADSTRELAADELIDDTAQIPLPTDPSVSERFSSTESRAIRPEDDAVDSRTAIGAVRRIDPADFRIRGRPVFRLAFDGTPWVFASGNGGIYRRFQRQSGGWSDWEQVGSDVDARIVDVLVLPNGGFGAFILTGPGRPMYSYQRGVSDTWYPFLEPDSYGEIRSPRLREYVVRSRTIGFNAGLYLFAVGSGGSVIWNRSRFDHVWQGWDYVGERKRTAGIVDVRFGPTTPFDVFVQDANRAVWRNRGGWDPRENHWLWSWQRFTR